MRIRGTCASTGTRRRTTKCSDASRSPRTSPRTTNAAFPLLLGSLTDAPFRNLALNWNRVVSPSLVNEVLVGYNQITIVTKALDWAGIGNANATFGIAGGQPIPGLSSIGWGGGLTSVGAGASDTDTLDKTYQVNEKLTWITGRQTLKVGGQLLHYVQQRYYAGNNGALGLFGYGGAFTGFPFSDFLLDQVASKGRGSLSDPWTHLHNRVALYVQDDFKVTPALTLNLGMRWAYTQPVVEKDNRQSNFDLTTGRQITAQDGSRESRSLYKSYKKGFEPRLGFAWRPNDRWVVRGGYGISQYMEGTGANLRLPLNPPFFFESAGQLRRDDGRRDPGDRLCGAEAARPAVGPGASVGSEPAATVHAAVERLRRISRHRFDVRECGIRRAQRDAPGDAGRRQPAAAWRGRSIHLGAAADAASAVRDGTAHYEHLDDRRARPQRLQRAAGSARQRTTKGLEYLASYTLSRVRTNNLGYYGSGGVNAEGAYWMNTYEPDWNYGPAFFDARHNFVFSANYELPFGRERKWASGSSRVVDAIVGGWRVSGNFQARTGFPITVTDGRGSSLQATRGNERPNCVGDPTPGDQNINHWLDINAFRRAAWHLGQLRDRRRARARLQEPGRRPVETLQQRRRAVFRIPGRGVQLDEHAKLRSAGARYQRAEHVRHDHDHGQHGADRGAGAEVLFLMDRNAVVCKCDLMKRGVG